MPSPALIIRPCFQQDLEQVQLIYAHHVMTSTGTFEIDPPSLDEITARWSHIVERGWSYLVASPPHDMSRVLGFAYAGQFRDRPGYAKAFESSVYVAPSSLRQGVGALLMHDLLSMLQGDGVREVLAFVGDSGNTASIQMHVKLGFRHSGTLQKVGEKFGRALDVVILQRSLAPPAP